MNPFLLQDLFGASSLPQEPGGRSRRSSLLPSCQLTHEPELCQAVAVSWDRSPFVPVPVLVFQDEDGDERMRVKPSSNRTRQGRAKAGSWLANPRELWYFYHHLEGQRQKAIAERRRVFPSPSGRGARHFLFPSSMRGPCLPTLTFLLVPRKDCPQRADTRVRKGGL
jgi:hypothetical protein